MDRGSTAGDSGRGRESWGSRLAAPPWANLSSADGGEQCVCQQKVSHCRGDMLTRSESLLHRVTDEAYETSARRPSEKGCGQGEGATPHHSCRLSSRHRAPGVEQTGQIGLRPQSRPRAWRPWSGGGGGWKGTGERRGGPGKSLAQDGSCFQHALHRGSLSLEPFAFSAWPNAAI